MEPDGRDRHLLHDARRRRRTRRLGRGFLVVPPLVLSIAFFLIADIDSPRRGAIQVAPLNLYSLAKSVRAQ
jgi:hypothetical protein